MAKKNVINNASGDFTIDPGASGDSWIQFNINTTNEFRIGVDDDDSDKFKISQGGALGTNDYFDMDTDGQLVMPLQPAFLAKRNSTLSNVTGSGTNYTVVFDGEILDRGSNYNNTTGSFTAPVTGRYFLCGGLTLEGLTANHDRGTVLMNTSNGFFYLNDLGIGAWRNSSDDFRISQGIFADMDAADTAHVSVIVDGEASNTVDINGSAGTTRFSHFSGFLVC